MCKTVESGIYLKEVRDGKSTLTVQPVCPYMYQHFLVDIPQISHNIAFSYYSARFFVFFMIISPAKMLELEDRTYKTVSHCVTFSIISYSARPITLLVWHPA